jgi:hypothetical protein
MSNPRFLAGATLRQPALRGSFERWTDQSSAGRQPLVRHMIDSNWVAAPCTNSLKSLRLPAAPLHREGGAPYRRSAIVTVSEITSRSDP